MVEPWNNSSVLPPPVNMFLCQKKFDVSAIKHVTNNIIKVLSKQSPLHKESAICSRFLYKYDKKFRNDIGYRNLKKVNTGLKKYLTLNLLKDIENFSMALPSESEADLYLPTRQMLEYVLLRIIAFAKIMLRISVCSKQAAIFYLDRIKRGESHWMSLLPYALLSRLWSMSKVLVQLSTTWYSNLYVYLEKLEQKGLNFLPDEYKLPEDLEDWLDLKNVDNFGRFDWAQSKNIEIDNTLIDDEEKDLFDNILGFINQINDKESEKEEKTEVLPDIGKKDILLPVSIENKMDHGEVLSRESFEVLNTNKAITEEIEPNQKNKIDHGEVLSRESFKVLHNMNQSTTKPKQTTQQISGKAVEHTYKNITNTDSLKKFIEIEDILRNESSSKSLTSHLSFMQWHALKNSLVKLSDTLTNRKIDKKFQKIWKQKCLDYK